jgi:biopolymer transport protein ExbD
MGARPSARRHKRQANQDINLVPLMNVFCILIPFLLLTAVFVQLTIINTNLPTASSLANKPKEADTSPTPEAKKLNLTVFITKEGFTLAGYGGVLNVVEEVEGDEEKKAASRTVIPMKVVDKDRNGEDLKEYDFEKLQEYLIKVKTEYPNHYSIILLPENQVLYETIIQVLDTSREYEVTNPDGSEEVKELFVNPVLAGGIT